MLFAFVWARLTRPFGTLWAARRLVRHGWLSLAALADLRRWRNEADDASSFIDRIAQLLPRLAQLDDDRLALNDATRELRVGFRLLELRELRPASAIEQKLEPVLGMIRAHFFACATARSQLPAPEPLHDALEAALLDLQRDASPSAHRAAQVVHGLRLALFADASASVRAAPGGPPPEAGLSPAGAYA